MSFQVKRRCSRLNLSFLLLLYALVPVYAHSATAEYRIDDHTVCIDENPVSSNTAQQRAERGKILSAAEQGTFAWEDVATRILGNYWLKITSEQKKSFTDALTDFLQTSYVKDVETCLAQQTNATGHVNRYYLKEIIDNRYAMIETRLNTGNKAVIGYKMINKQGEWFIYDLSVGTLALVESYHAQCEEMLARSSFDELVEKIKTKTETARTNKPKKTSGSLSFKNESCQPSHFSPSIIMNLIK